MLKKMMLLAVAVAALVAFAAPAVAQATELTGAEKGDEITATSTNLVTTLPSGAVLACSLVTIHGEVTENSPSVTIEPSATTTEGCITIAGPETFEPTTITNPTVGTIVIGESGGGSATAAFTADVPNLGLANCNLEGTVSFAVLSGGLSVGPSTINDPGGSGVNCPPSGILEGSFSLEKGGSSVVIH